MVVLRYEEEGEGKVPLYEGLDAVLPEAADNCAIAARSLERGHSAQIGKKAIRLHSTVEEGHRFLTRAVTKGDALTSWGMSFGRALVSMAAGDVLVNAATLSSLACREGLSLPKEPNFEDHHDHYEEQEEEQDDIEPAVAASFQGYSRGSRGVGTRNFIAVIPTSAAVSPWCTALAKRFEKTDGVDGVVSLAHTEGSGGSGGQAAGRLVRTLGGFLSHPNIAAALVVEEQGGVGAEIFEAARNCRGLPEITHLITLDCDVEEKLEGACAMITEWLPRVASSSRSACSLKELKVAQQCGGSDAFSGVSGNPAAGWCAKYLIERGGTALLAETDELMGAESYVLEGASKAVKQRFLEVGERYRRYLADHGQSPEANPSQGNRLRGLYNITLKSLGAAKKKHAETTLKGVVEYSEPLKEAGYLFMDSPGNDLESIAGQVAGGCNLVQFVTGSGSVTNFPFVPTVKIVTTSRRFALLARDMDFNAGRFQEGTALSALGMELFNLSVDVASGVRTKGEAAGHSQLSLWRAPSQLDFDPSSLTSMRALHGRPLVKAAGNATLVVSKGVSLAIPTSLCSSQVAAKIAERLGTITALPHTEGCGCGHAGDGELLYQRLVLGHLSHPAVQRACFLEHGCEKTTNAWLRSRLPVVHGDQYGWFSVQLGGGNDAAFRDVSNYFSQPHQNHARKHALTIGVIVGSACVELAQLFCAARLHERLLLADFGHARKVAKSFGEPPSLSLAFGQAPEDEAGLYLAAAPTTSVLEITAGLAAAHADITIVFTDDLSLVAGHPFVPTLHVAVGPKKGPTCDYHAHGAADLERLDDLLRRTIEGTYTPRSAAFRNFQIARGPTGVSA